MSSWKIAMLIVLPILFLFGCGGAAFWAINGGIYGCTPRDDDFAEDLASLRILDIHPPGTVAASDRYLGCDNDAGFAVAGQHYRPMKSREDVVSFYTTWATKNDWKPVHNTDQDYQFPCLTKKIDGTDAFLSIWFPSDLASDRPSDQFAIEVTASHDGDAWCL